MSGVRGCVEEIGRVLESLVEVGGGVGGLEEEFENLSWVLILFFLGL